MTVRHNPHNIANILSLKTVAARHHVMYDSTNRGGVFQVHTPDGVVEFKPSKRGLHFLDVLEEDTHLEYMLMHTSGRRRDGRQEEEKERWKEIMIVNTVRKNF